jgi:hypothetical protein
MRSTGGMELYELKNQRLYKLVNTGNAFLALPFSESCCAAKSNSA